MDKLKLYSLMAYYENPEMSKQLSELEIQIYKYNYSKYNYSENLKLPESPFKQISERIKASQRKCVKR